MGKYSGVRNRDRDCYVCPRTLKEAFGEGATLSVEAADKAGKRGDSVLLVLSVVGMCFVCGMLITGVI